VASDNNIFEDKSGIWDRGSCLDGIGIMSGYADGRSKVRLDARLVAIYRLGLTPETTTSETLAKP